MKRQGTNTYYTASVVTVTDINTKKLTATIYHTHMLWTWNRTRTYAITYKYKNGIGS